MVNLEKVDIIRERLGISYKEAKEALEQSGGDVLEALIFLEEKHDKTWMDTMSVAGNEIIEKLKAIIKKGNVSRIILKKDEEILLNVPITAGAIGVMLHPIISLLGVSAALVTKATIEIVKDDGEVVDINEIAVETVSELKNIVKGKKGANNTKNDNDTTNDEQFNDIVDDLDDNVEYF